MALAVLDIQDIEEVINIKKELFRLFSLEEKAKTL